MTTDVNLLQKAVAYCVETGATVAESAEEFGVDKAKLSQMMSELMNPQGGGVPADVAQFTQNSKVAHATIKVMGKSYEIVAVAVGSEKGATARIYDKNGMEIDAKEFKETYKIHSFKADHNTGEITVVAYDDAPGIRVAQEGKGNNFFDTLKNLWKRGRETANTGVVVVANRNDVASAGGTGKAADAAPADAGAGETKATANAKGDFAQLATDYGIPEQDAKIAEKTAKEVVGKMSDAEKTDLAEKLEAGDYDAFQKAIADLASGILPEDMPGISVNKPVFYATLAVAAAGVIAAALEAGAGAAISAVAEKVGQSGIDKIAMGLFGAVGLTSCSPDDGIGGKTDINQTVNITITQNSKLEEALDALLEGQKVTNALLQQILEREIENGMTAKEILDMCGGNAQLLSKILEAMTENNNLLTEVKNSINSGTENIMNALVDIKGSVDNITNLIKDFPQYSTQLNEIINGIKTGNKSMSDMKALIEQLLNQAVKNGDTQVNILNKLSEIEKSNKSDGEKLAAMLKLLGDIKTILQGVADDLKAHFKNDAKVNQYLETIIKNQEGQREEQTKTNEVLQQIYTLVEKLGTKGDALGKEILNYIAAVGFEMNRNFTAVLEAINKGVAGADSLRDLLEKVLDKQDKNTKAIIEAIGNIKVGPGGAVDLSSIEKMLAELLKQSQKNGDILSNIDAKTDVIATTTKSILDALNKEFGKNDERYKNINNLLTVIANKAGGKGDDAALLEKLDKILQKLDEIKDAIKNHKVEVDVTGKVTCECNCGKNHEGILGDLNDILS